MDQRWIALGTAAVGAVLLVVGAFSGQWLTGGDTYGMLELNISLRAIEICSDGSCKSGVLGTFGAGDLHQVKTLGLVCLVLGIGSAVSLVGAGILGVLEKAKNWFIAPSTIAILLCGLALIIGVVTLVSFRGRVPDFDVGTGLGFVLYGMGSAAGLVGAILVGRFPHPDEEYFEPPFEPV